MPESTIKTQPAGRVLVILLCKVRAISQFNFQTLPDLKPSHASQQRECGNSSAILSTKDRYVSLVKYSNGSED